MTVFEIAFMGLCGVAAVAVLVRLHRYTEGRLKRAAELEAEGWVCVGIDFIGGPIMVPPPAARPPRLVARWQSPEQGGEK